MFEPEKFDPGRYDCRRCPEAAWCETDEQLERMYDTVGCHKCRIAKATAELNAAIFKSFGAIGKAFKNFFLKSLQ